MSTEKKEMSPKTKKIINIVVDVVVAIVLALALFLAICTITSKSKGYDQYTEVFGKAYLAVQSDSMKGDKEDNFSRGDLITIKTLSEEETKNLKVGDIITFKDPMIVNGKYVLNTHRIIEVNGNIFVTHGDNNPAGSNETVRAADVIGIYQGKAGGIGHLFIFMSSSTGFFVCVVLPTLLIVVYFAVNLVLVILKEKKAQAAEAEQAAQAQVDERERMRQELLAELQSQGAVPAVQPAESAQNTDNKPETDSAESAAETPAEESDGKGDNPEDKG